MPTNQVVVLLTPVFTTAAALGSAWLAKHGLDLPKEDVLAVEKLSAVAALGAAGMWLRGHHIELSKK